MSANPEKLVNRFSDAVHDMAFLGAIPLFSDDREEQAAIDAERGRIQRNYSRTRNALLKALEAAKATGA